MSPEQRTLRIKILVRKKLNMSSGKLAAQAVHAALALPGAEPNMSVAVLQVSERNFAEAKEMSGAVVIRDAGRTEVAPGTETAVAFLVSDETQMPWRISQTDEKFEDWRNAVAMIRAAGYVHPADLLEDMAEFIDKQHGELLLLRDECGRMPDGRAR